MHSVAQKANLNTSIINADGDEDEMHRDDGGWGGIIYQMRGGKWLFWGIVKNIVWDPPGTHQTR